MEKEITSTLKEYGLSDKESSLFIYLVGNKGITAYQLAKETNIFKSTCYDVLDRLIEKGFVSKSTEDGKTIYFAKDITEILGLIKSKEELLISLIPKLNLLESKEKTTIKQVDSESAFLGVNSKIAELAKKNELSFVYMLGNNSKMTTKSSIVLIERLINELSKEKIKKNIKCRGIWDPRFKKDTFMKQFNLVGENKFIKLPSEATTIIYDGYVVFFFIESKPNIIEIKNKKIANEMKSYFEHLWTIAKK